MYLIVLIIILVSYYIWHLGYRNFDYWAKKGVKYDKPTFFFGNTYKQFMMRISLPEQVAEWYKLYPDERYVGAYFGNDAVLVLRDPELIKHFLVTDFRYFHQRGIHPHKTIQEPLFQNLFTADGDTWKLLRQRLTSAFTSGKLKAMFPLIVKTSAKMLSVAETSAGEVIDVRELMARYTTDFIGICGFGLDFDSLNEENSKFRRLGKRIFKSTTRDAFVQIFKRFAPELFKHIDYFVPEIQENTLQIMREVMEKRNYTPSGRNDFIDLLLELKAKGTIVGESIEHMNPDGSRKMVSLELDELVMAAQVFIFFAAGFETSSSASSFLLHELAYHQEVQKRCQREIDEVLRRHDGQITYEAIKEMKYLEMAFKEAMRLYPSPGFLMRRSGQSYTLPGGDVTIDKDVTVLISLLGLHRDKRFFKDPDNFDPDRFLPNNGDGVPKYVFMPFGEGPRACIGERLGLIQSLAGICALLSRFSVHPASISRRRPLFDPKFVFVLNAKGGLQLTLTRRNNL